MTSKPLISPCPRWARQGRAVAVGAVVAFGGVVGSVQAQTEVVDSTAIEAPLAEAARTSFTPSPQAEFEEAFAHLDGQLAMPNLPDHAVDISEIEAPRGPQVERTLGRGVASYYGRRFDGRLTASGERFDMTEMTAAHKTLPFGSRVRVTNPDNGRSVIVRINDRGPYTRGREIDLSRAAAEELGMIRRGHATVELELLAD